MNGNDTSDIIMSRMYFRLIMALVVCLVLSAIFYFFPEIDLRFSSVFYHSRDGFFLAGSNWVVFLEKAPKISAIIAILLMMFFMLRTFFYTRSFKYKHYIAHIYIILVFILGTVVMVDQGLKEYSGRARPYQTEAFGGNKKFTGAYHKTTECSRNCSFVSAHAAAAFAFIGFAFVVTNRYRRVLIEITVMIAGLVAGFARIVEGKHFLSDIVLCGVYIYILAVVLAIIMKPYKHKIIYKSRRA